MYQSDFSVKDVEIIERHSQYRGFAQVEQVTLKHRLFETRSWSQPIVREVVRRRAAAGVLVYDRRIRQFLLIEQFRIGALNHPDTAWQLEVIAGLIDEGETAEQCIRREAQEEAGCTLEEVHLLYRFYPSAGGSDEIYTLYAASACLSQAGGVFGQVDEQEDIKVHMFYFDEIDSLLRQFSIANAPVLIALQWLQQQCDHVWA